MRFFLQFFSAIVLAANIRGNESIAATATKIQHGAPTLLQQYPFYHTSEQLSDKLVSLMEKCPYAKLERVPLDHNSSEYIEVVTIRQGEKPSNRFLLLAGEHARELISPESALHFINVLCGEKKDLASEAQDVLRDTEFKIIPNGNPISRRKVELGDFCLRVNENGVDLNRNWADHWDAKSPAGPDTDPGQRPFSEREVQVFKRVASHYKPHVFLSIHSGTLGMYTPYAYTAQTPRQKNEEKMLSILKELDDNFCQCPYGSAAKEVGYLSHGTCMDYMYDKMNVPFAYAFEIFTSPTRREKIQQLWKTLQDATAVSTSSLKSPHFRDFFSSFPSEFVELKKRYRKLRTREGSMTPEVVRTACFDEFNPTDADEYVATVLNWSKAYLQLAKQTAAAQS